MLEDTLDIDELDIDELDDQLEEERLVLLRDELKELLEIEREDEEREEDDSNPFPYSFSVTVRSKTSACRAIGRNSPVIYTSQ